MDGTTKDRLEQADLPEVLIADLPLEHVFSDDDVTAESEAAKRKRLVFVGDVHGHLKELQALLDKINFNHRHGDHLVLLGDIVAKGPDSGGVVKLAMEVGASGVRGNHEDKVLLAHKHLQKKKKKPHHKDMRSTSDASSSEVDEPDTAEVTSSKSDHARAVARSLTHKQISWLSSLPICLRVSHLSNITTSLPPWNAHEILVVHAGLVPSVPLEEQDPWAMMNMRTLIYPSHPPKSSSPTTSPSTTDPLIAIPSNTRSGEPWSRAWNRHHNLKVSPEERTVVIYGHDAKAGLQTDLDVVIHPHPAEKHKHKHKHKHRKGHKGHKGKKGKHGKRAENSEDAEATEINIEISNPEVSVNGDGDVEVETEIEIEVEVEENSGNGTASGDPSLPSDKLRRMVLSDHEEEYTEDGEDVTEGEADESEEGGEVDAERKKHKKKGKKQKGIRYAFGLDSGCGHGRQLSALVLEVEEGKGVVHKIEQVECFED